MNKIFVLCHRLLKLNFPKLYLVIYAFIIISAFLQLVGTISIIPLITMLVHPEFILEHELISNFTIVKKYTNEQLTILFASLFIVFIFVSQLFLFFSAILNTYITTLITHNLRKKYYKKILEQYLTLYLKINISHLSTIVGNEVSKIGDHINSYLSILRDTLILLIIFLLDYFLLNQKTIIGGILGSLIFYFIYLKSKKNIKKMSHLIFIKLILNLV